MRRPALTLGLIAGLPLMIAAVVLASRPWTPVLDLAMTELRVRDVGGRHTPLVGLPGRIGDFPDQGSHPGPWSFVLIAPLYRLVGATAWGLELASVVINVASVGLLAWMGRRRFGRRGAICFAALGAVAIRGYGLNVLTHPWNPYFPVLLWMVAVVAGWLVLDGDHWLAPLVAATTVVAAQTHVPYLLSAIALDAVIVGVLARRWWSDGGSRASRPLLATVGVAALMWIPPIAEQLRYGSDDGNLAKLIRHFATDQHEPTIGVAPALRLLTQHFDVVAIGRDLLLHDDALLRRAGQIDGGTSVAGTLVLLVWGAAILWAAVRRHRTLLALHSVAATTAIAGLVSISRIFGKVWFYLTLWMSATVLLVMISLVWTGWLLLVERRPASDRRTVPALAVCAGVIATAASLVAVPGQHVPEDAGVVRDLMPIITEQLDEGAGAAHGHDGSYVVFWEEAIVPGSLGYALLNELEREGFRVGVHPTWRIPATRHRVRFEGQYDAEIHLVTGQFIDVWRSNPDYVEIAFLDPRTTGERDRFEQLRGHVFERLDEIGRGDLIAGVDENIFRTSLTPGLPGDIVDDLDEMLRLGDPVAVFVAPPGSTF